MNAKKRGIEVNSPRTRVRGRNTWCLPILTLPLLLTAPLIGCQSQPPTADKRFAEHDLVGVWYWQRPANKCTEVYRYYDDGTYAVISGREIATGTYTVAKEANAAGRYKVDRVTVTDNRGQDCANKSKDSTGMTSTIYVRFHESGKLMAVMYDPTGSSGFGPLVRLAK